LEAFGVKSRHRIIEAGEIGLKNPADFGNITNVRNMGSR